MNKYLKFVSPVIFIFCFILVFSLKAMSNGKLWENYSVLYVPAETSDSEVLTTFEETDIKNYVALSNQYLPLNLSANSVEIAMLKLNYSNEEYNYTQKRNSFFFDKSNKYRLYYIPKEYKSNLSECINILNAKKIECGVDTSSTYPWMLPLVGLILVILMCMYSKNKTVFILGELTPLVYIYSNPFYPNALSFCLLSLSIFFISNIWRRKDAIKYLLSKQPTPVLVLLSIIAAFSSSSKSGLLFLICLCAITSVLYTYFYLQDYFRNKKSFIPVYIKPAKMVSVFAKNSKTISFIISVSAIIFISLFFITQLSSVNSHFAKLLLPSSVDSASKNLPQLEDYYEWAWNVKTYPYKSLNSNNDEQKLIEYQTYNEVDGQIIENKIIMEYNQDFKDSILKDIDNLPFESVEKVLKTESSDIKTGYSSTSNYHTNLFGIIMMIICLFILLFILFSVIIRKGEKNDFI